MHLARLAVFCLVVLPAAGLAQDGKLTLDTLLEWETVAAPRLSPDGTQIVFTRGGVDAVNDRPTSELWIMARDGSRQRFLAKGSSARWSPGGKRIAFLAAGQPRGSQIHVMWVDTREVTQVTRVSESPSGLRWSPDGKTIAFTMVVPAKKTAIEKALTPKLPKRPKGAKWASDPRVVTRLNYRRDHRGYRPKGYRHLFVVDATRGTPRQVTHGDFDHGSCEWTPDGKTLLTSGLRRADAAWQIRESEVYAVDVASGKTRALTSRRGPDGGPRVSPDGRHIAYAGFDMTRDTYNVAQIWVMNADGTGPRSLTPQLDRQPRSLSWGDDETIYFSVDSEGARNLWRVRLDGKPEPVTRGPQVFTPSHVRGNTIVGTLATAEHPTDVAILEAGSTPKRLTDVNADVLHGVAIGATEELRYKSVDDFEIQGWIIKPPHFDAKKTYPLILQIHGGPHGMYNVGFSFERQNHAANGYVVLYTNPRGSVGYGKQFGNAINNAYPGRDYHDLMLGVDEVIKKGYIDERELFVYGGSGGGVLTAWTVGHTDRFAAAVSMYPVIDWISFVGTTDGPYWYHNFAKFPWEDISEHWRRSPLKYAGNVTTPTLLITGELDLRTPISQTEEFYQALKWRRVDTAMIRVPDEYHGAAGRHVSNRLRRILYVRNWFERYRPKKRAAEADVRR